MSTFRTGSLIAALLASVLTGSALAVSPHLDRLGVDASRSTIDVGEVLSGGPPPQGIPALGFAGLRGVADASREPRFVGQDFAADWVGEREPVILMRLGGEARIYPLQILTWHEIVNDTLGGVPVAVTFCPLCNSALAFDRRVPATEEQVAKLRGDGRAVAAAPLPDDLRTRYGTLYGADAPELGVEVTFGVSGLLFHSNMLMFDDTTRTLWAQLVGEGVIGELAGNRLVRYAAQIVSFAEATAAEPDAQVLSRETGYVRSYGHNPYIGYDTIGSPAFLFRGDADGRLAPKERVVSIDGDQPVAYTFVDLREARVANDVVGGDPIVVLWQAGTTTAVGGPVIARADDVGAVGVFRRSVAGRTLTFEADDDGFRDLETGSRWDVTGLAVEGELEGTLLEPVPHDNTLWFAWAAFRPETEVRTLVAERHDAE